MANRVISIEVGKSITRAVEMDYKVKNPKVYSCFSFETPAGVFEDGMIRADENFCNVLKGAMKHFRIKSRKVVFTVNSGRIASRDIKIPLVKDNKIYTLLKANSSEYFPMNLAEYQLVYRINQKVDTKEGRHYNLSVLAVPNDLVRSYRSFATDCGLQIMAMDYVGNSVVQVMKRSVKDGGVVLVKIDENSSMITIMREGQVDLQRNISYGIEDAVETMIGTNAYGTALSYADAVQVMRKKTCIRRHLDVEIGYSEEEDETQDIAQAREEITDSLRMLIGNIRKVLDYYISRNSEVAIRNIKLIGLGADCGGLSKLMTNELGIKVTSFMEFPGVNLNRIGREGTIKVAEYVACIGASMNPLNFRLGEKIDSPISEKEGSLLFPGFVFLVCAGVSAALIGISLYKIYDLESQRDTYNDRLTELYSVQQAYNACNTALEEFRSCEAMYALTNTTVTKFSDFLTEMESMMPSDILVESLSASAEGININVSMSSKESLAEALIQFREFESVSAVSCGGMNEETNELGSKRVRATIVCTFSTADTSTEN